MTTWRLLTSAWAWEPSVALGCASLFAAYVWSVGRFAAPRQIAMFAGGVLLLLLALVSPLDVLGDRYLFSAHMLQHMLLVLPVPPMLLAGVPAQGWAAILRNRALARVAGVLSRPAVAWIMGVTVLWVWHLPTLYSAALDDERVHIMEHLMFLASATVFWWPICSPAPRLRLGPFASLGYLFAGSLACAALGTALTFAPAGLYPEYLRPADSLGALSLIREGWGLTAAADQQLGGLFMSVLGSLFYLGAILLVLARWLGSPEQEVVEEPAAVRLEGQTSSRATMEEA